MVLQLPEGLIRNIFYWSFLVVFSEELRPYHSEEYLIIKSKAINQ